MRRQRQLPLVAPAVILLVCLAPAAARADAGQARVHFERGKGHFEADDYRKAIEEFKAAHGQHPDPAFLYSIAECHRRAGEPRDALAFYRGFLAATPPGDKTRANVERRIAELQAADASLAVPEPAAPTPLLGQSPPPVEARPLYTRSWFLATVGAVVVVTAVSIWALSRERDLPGTALGNQSVF
jgi:tetratricopeptide (TPR) repeat protein